MQAVADEGTLDLFLRYSAYTPDRASTNSPEGFLAMCGVVGLGRLLAEGDLDQLMTLRACANDPRWRMREAVAMGLQRWGDADMPALLKAMNGWVKGTLLERRAVAAAVCEPRLLKIRDTRSAWSNYWMRSQPRSCGKPIGGPRLQDAASSVGLLLSVAVVALHRSKASPAMEKWLVNPDPDVAWIMRENLKKNRLQHMDANWVKEWSSARVR